MRVIVITSGRINESFYAMVMCFSVHYQPLLGD